MNQYANTNSFVGSIYATGPMELQSPDTRARNLLQDVADGCESGRLGSATVAVYDTAWVSMVAKNIGGRAQWLFPECFQFLLDNQLDGGGWESDASSDDGILNTLAALLALKKHSNQADKHPSALAVSISKAKRYLEDKLPYWDVGSGVHVGFEILVPALLTMLEKEEIFFTFSGRSVLENLRAAKLAHFDVQMIYGGQTTLLHSLEAFVGEIDFDMLEHCKTFGSMMGSPASTAAYLINSSRWDSEAENYLRMVLDEGQGKGSGGIPSVFPMPVFEATWVLSTLFQSTFSVLHLGTEPLDRITAYLQDLFNKQNGLLGFAPSVLADADDTAKAILVLNRQGKQTSPKQMIKYFEIDQHHFRTYPGERNASFSANCNVLQALLSCNNVQRYAPQISSITGFLCDSWWAGTVQDKWNHSLQYSMMLLSGAMIHLLELYDRDVLKLPAALLQDQVPVVLTQIVNRTLLTQFSTGAWGANGSPEATAYGVLTLAALITLPWFAPLRDQVDLAMQEGQKFLLNAQRDWDKPQLLWIEKVTYGSRRLSEAYCLAAMMPSVSTYGWSDRTINLVDISGKFISRFLKLISSLSDFESEPLWTLKASAIEGHAFLPLLRSARTDILPRQKGAKNQYFDLIPCTWVLINNHKKLFLQANILWDMMVLTVCNFRVDEYMETVVAKFGSGTMLELVKAAIRTLCVPDKMKEVQSRKRPHEDSARITNSTNQSFEENTTNNISDFASFKGIIGHYIHAMLDYPRLQQASSSDRMHLRSELQTFLLSHTAQIEDNARFSAQEPHSQSSTEIFVSTRLSYYEWVHTTGADSVSCPFSFAFFTCLLGSSLRLSRHPEDCFSSIQQSYLAHDLCGHLAVMSRLYNDYGSLARDRKEANVNSANFPEFHRSHAPGISAVDGAEHTVTKESRLKADLLEVAKYERESADMIGQKLLEKLRASGSRKERGKADGVTLFMGVTGLYADMYVQQDLSNHIQKPQ